MKSIGSNMAADIATCAGNERDLGDTMKHERAHAAQLRRVFEVERASLAAAANLAEFLVAR
jgi:hypothetical protein